MNRVLDPIPMTHSPALRDILLGHLRTIGVHYWPGVDGITLNGILSSYFPAALAGQVPDKEELLRQHPKLAAELETFFTVSQPSAARY